jgi:hypothetical protein
MTSAEQATHCAACSNEMSVYEIIKLADKSYTCSDRIAKQMIGGTGTEVEILTVNTKQWVTELN